MTDRIVIVSTYREGFEEEFPDGQPLAMLMKTDTEAFLSMLTSMVFGKPPSECQFTMSLPNMGACPAKHIVEMMNEYFDTGKIHRLFRVREDIEHTVFLALHIKGGVKPEPTPEKKVKKEKKGGEQRAKDAPPAGEVREDWRSLKLPQLQIRLYKHFASFLTANCCRVLPEVKGGPAMPVNRRDFPGCFSTKAQWKVWCETQKACYVHIFVSEGMKEARAMGRTYEQAVKRWESAQKR